MVHPPFWGGIRGANTPYTGDGAGFRQPVVCAAKRAQGARLGVAAAIMGGRRGSTLLCVRGLLRRRVSGRATGR